MLSDKLVEIMEAIWCAAEKDLNTQDAIRQNCTVLFDELPSMGVTLSL